MANKKHTGQSEFSRFVYQLSKNKMAMIGLVIIALEILIAIFAPMIAPYGYQEIDATALRQAPSAAHWFGTDEIGRDIFSRVLIGTRSSFPSLFFFVRCRNSGRYSYTGSSSRIRSCSTSCRAAVQVITLEQE